MRAGLDVRFFGDSHSPTAPHLFSWFIELDPEEGAMSALDLLEADTMKPCPAELCRGDKRLRRRWHPGCARRPSDRNGRGHRGRRDRG